MSQKHKRLGAKVLAAKEERRDRNQIRMSVDQRRLDSFTRDYPCTAKFIEPLRARLAELDGAGMTYGPEGAYAALKATLAGVEYVDRRNIATEETSGKKHAKFWTASILSALRERGVKVILLRLISGSDLRVCLCFEDPTHASTVGQSPRLLVYNVFFSPHCTDSEVRVRDN